MMIRTILLQRSQRSQSSQRLQRYGNTAGPNPLQRNSLSLESQDLSVRTSLRKIRECATSYEMVVMLRMLFFFFFFFFFFLLLLLFFFPLCDAEK